MNIKDQSKALEEKIKLNENWVDLNYEGFNAGQQKGLLVNKNSFEKYNEKAHINRVLFWLSSKRGDFGRGAINRGGLLYDLLGSLTRDTDLTSWENSIKDQFNEEFSNDLKLVLIHLEVDKFYKKLTINMVVQDMMTKIPFRVNTEVEK